MALQHYICKSINMMLCLLLQFLFDVMFVFQSQIPGGLTDEMLQEQAERKRTMKKVKREKGKEKRKEEEEKKEETLEKERFLKLSDREKVSYVVLKLPYMAVGNSLIVL